MCYVLLVKTLPYHPSRKRLWRATTQRACHTELSHHMALAQAWQPAPTSRSPASCCRRCSKRPWVRPARTCGRACAARWRPASSAAPATRATWPPCRGWPLPTAAAPARWPCPRPPPPPRRPAGCRPALCRCPPAQRPALARHEPVSPNVQPAGSARAHGEQRAPPRAVRSRRRCCSAAAARGTRRPSRSASAGGRRRSRPRSRAWPAASAPGPRCATCTAGSARSTWRRWRRPRTSPGAPRRAGPKDGGAGARPQQGRCTYAAQLRAHLWVGRLPRSCPLPPAPPVACSRMMLSDDTKHFR